MSKIRVTGVELCGVSVSDTEVLKSEVPKIKKSRARVKPLEVDQLKEISELHGDPFPSWSVGKGLGPRWPFNFNMALLRRWWGFGVISEELLLLQCISCKKSFAIIRLHQQECVFCPYCRSEARQVVNQEEYLTAMLKKILSRNGKEFLEVEKWFKRSAFLK
jgi:hypothetical protein